MHHDKVYDPTQHASVRALCAFFRNYIQLEIPSAQNHWFRHSLITHRVRKGCELWLSEVLQGHASNSTQVKAYIHLGEEQMRVDWFKWHPYDF